MVEDIRIYELQILKVIAETLNQSNDLYEMLQEVLEELLEVTGFETGWFFLIDSKESFAMPADYNLPPALIWGEKKPMCEGTCWCLDRYNEGRLQHAVNIIECKRIEDAIENKWGDTKNMTHHATVPLFAGKEYFGLLNVASANKTYFTDEELTLLEGVALQIGTAINRTRLYHLEQKRAELFQKLGDVNAVINAERSISSLYQKAAPFIIDKFLWLGVRIEHENHIVKEIPDHLKNLQSIKHRISLGETFVTLTVFHELLDEIDRDVIHQLAYHLAIAFENARLYEKQRDLTLIEERNRLARDLHDSVNQLLFSLMLTVRGTKEMTKDKTILDSLSYIQELSQEALKEMRALIWQLRPKDLENGIVTALRVYGQVLGLDAMIEIDGIHDLPNVIEETLWRIGQEALNNVKKHAKTDKVSIKLERNKYYVDMIIHDKGIGFKLDEKNMMSLGIKGMKERAEILKGKVTISSHNGTTVSVSIPIK